MLAPGRGAASVWHRWAAASPAGLCSPHNGGEEAPCNCSAGGAEASLPCREHWGPKEKAQPGRLTGWGHPGSEGARAAHAEGPGAGVRRGGSGHAPPCHLAPCSALA